MDHRLVDDGLWEQIVPLLPQAAQPKPGGGRPRVTDRAALNGILFILATGSPWDELPPALGCGSGMTCWRRLRAWQRVGVWPRVTAVLRARLGPEWAATVDWSRAERRRTDPVGSP